MIGLSIQRKLERAGYTPVKHEDLERLMEAYEQLKGLKKLEKNLRAYHNWLKQLAEKEKMPYREG